MHGAPLSIKFEDFDRIVFFTGAGLSAESGIPTYRGAGGIWHKYNYEDYACQRAFDEDPSKVWDFHEERREAVAACNPNRAHHIIAEVQQTHPSTVIITQNIDGLHQRAGSDGVVELHGSLWRMRCDYCGAAEENLDVPLAHRFCPCGKYWRPDIVWFEDMLNPSTLEAAAQALQDCDLLVSVGTSGLVYPAADLPRRAVQSGAVTVEINLEDTPVTPLYQHAPRGKASEVLAGMWD